tara:strand:- start:5497 stop:6069 length:573 start_codon:yes stop_codon:yes gene_type:complete
MATPGFIIYLPDYEDSLNWASQSLTSGTLHNWNLQLYPGVNGHKETLSDYNIKIFQGSKKCVKYMSRPGTQGCFLSHWKLWNKAKELNTTISIIEHDIIFTGANLKNEFCDIIKFEGFKKAKPIPPGNWWEGARAYSITPIGADKILSWIDKNGAMPADWMLCDGIVDIVFDNNNTVEVNQHNFSFTRDL